ncbi:MAG: YggT family protein [Hellea sp.]|nr:YggT family protein [Hellea sp.]
MNFAQSLIVHFIGPVIDAYVFLIVAYIIMGWLAAFDVINLRNHNVRQIYGLLERISGIVLNPIRKILPPMGGLDFSPIVAILGLYWVRNYVFGDVLYKMLG